MANYEKLGAFYLGRRYDLERDEVLPEDVLYDAKDLTTHAVCVGMTGSGKTGLCVGLLEEAAIDGIPALVIDPKGDLGNLLLTFPELRPGDFEPWIDPAEAARAGRSVEEHARATAELWRNGLARWDQPPGRIARLREAADLRVYTPGASAGAPLSVLRSLAPPSEAVAADPDALRERVMAAVSGLLALVGVDPDPVRSREHILLSALVDAAWRAGRSLDLAALIRGIQEPPFQRLGVLDLESFFPARERFALAMTLNNLLASPAFAAWSEGDPLDVGRLLYAPDGRPRIAILSIAHLSDAERMFFVTVLLNEVVAWMRSQSGTSSLRALLYMDEVFGFLPPSANPPSKLPLLTLLKQARAFGLGVVLATQNPVDLDYKALSNAGTWFLGRLQTERDKARVLDGLEGAATGAEFSRADFERVLSGLDSRVFLLHNVHEDAPVVFHTRWALSYLRGPLTRTQLCALAAPAAAAAAPAPSVASRPRLEPEPEPAAAERPLLPPKVDECFLAARGGGAGSLLYRPALLGTATLHYTRARTELDVWERVTLLAQVPGSTAKVPWTEAQVLEGSPDLFDEPEPGARFAELPASAAREKSYTRWSKMLASHLYRSRPLRLWKSADPKGLSRAGESEGEFRGRLRQLLHEQRDTTLEKLRARYAPKVARLQERVRKAEARVDREKSQYQQQKMQTAISIGSTVLGALFGRKLSSVGRATTAARGVGRAARERGDVGRAEEDVAALESQLGELEAELQEKLDELRDGISAGTLELEELAVKPRKGDLTVERVALVWTPWRVGADGKAHPDAETG